MKWFLESMHSRGGISSKRVWGSIIMLMLCVCYVVCTIQHTEMPSDTDAFITLAGLLLGLDTIMSPFKGKFSNNDYNETTTPGDNADSEEQG